MKALLRKIRQILKDRKTRRFITRFVSAGAAFIVFVTTYALVLPAITMESEAACGIEAHQHDDSCYEDVLICGQEESDGHSHTDDCYTVTQELVCPLEEHQHSEENGCFDEGGNLICQQEEHTHSEENGCYEEKRELTCTLEESEGHHHTDACYEKNLICGKEVHTHSPACYEKEAADAVVASAGYTAGLAYEAGDTDASGETGNIPLSNENSSLMENAAADATTNVLLPEDLANEDLSEGYVPQLDSLNFDAVLNDHTGFYYFHPEEGEEVPANTVDITSWEPVDKNTELAPTDLVKAYLSYTIPAGSLNETNQIARYRLPANIHLTDDQIIAINNNENGIAAGYVDPSTNTVLNEDANNYHKYLGAEAVEGTRRPDQDLQDARGDGSQEYISATVKAENIFDEEGIYGEKGAYLGQDLIFVFSPYTIEKNQTTYDTAGNPTAKGEKVTGWFAVDLNMEQIDWVEEETREELIDQVTGEPASDQIDQIEGESASGQADQIDQTAEEHSLDENTNKTINIIRTTIVKSAEIIFAEENKDVKASEISRRLKLVEYTEREEEADAVTPSSDEVTEADTAAAAEDAVEETVDEGAVEDQVPEDEAGAESTTEEDQATEGVTSDDNDQEAEDKDKETQGPEYKAGSLKSEGDDYKITLDYTAEAKIPADAVLSVREITAETDPEVYQACLDQANAHEATGDSTVDQQTSRFFDIEIVVTDEEGQQKKIEPAAPVSVNIQLPEKKDADQDKAGKENNSTNKDSKDAASAAKNAASGQDPTVLHFAEEGVEQVEAETTVNETRKDSATEVQFQAESFSIYGVIYTVDFYWEVDGKTYEYSLAGGDSVSFRELLKLLHVIGTADDAQENGEQENGTWLDKITGLFKNNDEQDAGDVPGEDINQFINDIASVRFSDESLVKVAPITEETTAGALKDKLGLVCEYSAELSDAQRKAMDSKTFYPTDWALISLKAFSTEEYLTVEMKNGEKFQIRVTDAQIKKTVIDAKGDTWEITVTYGEDAQIPDSAELKVEEILPQDDRYQVYFDKAMSTTSGLNPDTTVVDEKENEDIPGMSPEASTDNENTSDADTTEDDYARFFDISIWDDKEEIKPQAAVLVNIKLLDAPEEENHCPAVVHFGSSGPEVMELKEQEEKEADEGLTFATDSFSIYGVIYTVDFHWELDGKKYAFNLKGGDAVSFSFLAETLKLANHYKKVFGPEPEVQDEVETANNTKVDTNDEDANAPGETVANQMDAAEPDPAEKETFIDITGLDQSSVTLSDETRAFLDQVESVTFSTPEYLWVDKIEEDTTAGDLMAANELVPVYPNGTTDQDFCKIYMRKFTAPDWVLIALQPFETEEALTITMKNGDRFDIRVTDDADAVLIPDGQGGQKVQTISNPSGTTIDLFDYYITTDTRDKLGKNGWPGHQGDINSTNNGVNGWNFDTYDYNGNIKNDNNVMANDPDRNNDAYMKNGYLRGNGNNQGINAGHIFKFYPGAAGSVEDYGDKDSNHIHGTNNAWTNNHDKYNSINSWTGSADPTTGLVTDRLSGGYPQLTNDPSKGTGTIYNSNGTVRYNGGESLSYLFDHNNFTGKEYKGEVNQLLYVDSDGYYTYDSRYYSAKLENDNNFTVRKFADSIATDSAQRGFWPFGDRVNWHGMHMQTKFSMPADGKVLNPNGVYKDMQFEFSGDDDTWLYIDGILVGDGGGIHNRTEIDINFNTGLVTVKGTADPNHKGSYVWTKYLDEIYRDAGASTEDFEGHTFKQGTYHTFDMFYLERGGSESNLYIHYNLVSTADFTAHKSYHTQSGDSRLARDQFQFELIGLDGKYEGEPGSRTLVPGDTSKAIMPKGGSASGAGTVASPRIENTTTTLSTGTYSSQTFTVGVSEDGNVNFGDAEISQALMHDCDEGHPATYRYIVREKVPEDAVNADGKTWAAASDEERAEGGFTKGGITYDEKIYYFEGTVRKKTQINPVSGQTYEIYDIQKTRYTDDTYTNVDNDTKFFSFMNGYVEKLELKINKKGYAGEDTENTWPLSEAKFKISRAKYDEATQTWSPRPNSVSREATTGEDGYLSFPAMREGHYILEEEKAPEGYLPSGNKWLVTLTKVDTETRIVLVPTITLLDEHGKVAVDGTTGQPIIQSYDVEDIQMDQTSVANPSNPEKVEMAEYDILNRKEPKEVVVEKAWKKYNGEPYSAEELAALGNKVSGITVTGELWRTATVPDEHTCTNPKVTIKAKYKAYAYNNPNWPYEATKDLGNVTVEYGGAIYIAFANNQSGYPAKVIVDGTNIELSRDVDASGTINFTGTNPSVSKNNPRLFKLANITSDVTIIADFYNHPDKPSAQTDGNIGYYIDEQKSNVTTEATSIVSEGNREIEEKVKAPGTQNTTFTLNQANGWTLVWDDDDLDEGNYTYTYELRNVVESDTDDFTFTQGPKTETVDPQTGKLTVHFPLSNQRNTELVDIPVVKSWDPMPDDEANASVNVELHRYAKVTKGTFTVELKTEEGGPIQDATFTLYKDGEVFRDNLKTDENGQISQTGLNAGTYYYRQKDTPFAYTMQDCTTQTGEWRVEGNLTTSQMHTEYLTNKAKKAVGTVTLTLVDSVNNTAINGATFDLYKGNDLYRSNLVTAGEGEIEEGNLEAGMYRFVQTGYLDGYKHNVVTYDPPTFTVDANIVGTTQEKSVNATNTKIAKGSATVTLKRKDDNTPISGAEFELLQNGSVIQEGTTDNNGQVTFANLGAGKYTIKQASTTGNLSLAGNETFEIEDNGRDDQGNSFELTNDVKAGKITVELHRAQGESTGNTQNTGGNKKVDEWTQLKPGTTIRVKIQRVQSGHNMYYCTDYRGNGWGTWVKIQDSEWNGNVYYLPYTIPSSPEEATYKIGVSSGWGIDSGTVSFMNKPESGSGTNAATGTAGRMLSYLPKPVRTLLSAGNGDDKNSQDNATRTVPVIHTDANSLAPPTDYVDDSSFTVQTYTLRHTNDSATDWRHVFKDLEKYDPDGNEYVYYVVEKERTPDDYWVDKYEKDESTGTITIKNKKETTGVVRVTKTFSGIDQLPDNFQITNDFNSDVFTIDGRNGTVAPTSTDPYTWTISDVPAGRTVTFTESGIQVNGYNLTVNSSMTSEVSATVTSGSVVAGAYITAELVNDYESKKTSVTLKKVDKNDLDQTAPDLLKGASFTLSKYNSAEFRGKDDTWGTAGSKVLTDTKNPDGTYTLNGVFTFDDLTMGFYQIEETAFPDGYISLTSKPTFKVEANESNELVITLLNNPDNLLRLVDGELTIRVGNEPGAALPNSGGPGTRLFYLLGIALAGFAGAGLLLRKHRSPGRG